MGQSQQSIHRGRSAFRCRLALALLCGSVLASCTGATQAPVTPTDTASVTPTPTITASPAPDLSPSPDATVSPSIAASPTPTISPTVSPLATPGKSESTVKVEQQVSDLLTKATSLTVRSVSCPTGATDAPNNTYECQVQSDVGEFVVVVQPTGQPGKFRWGTKNLLLLSKLDTLIQKSVQSQGGGKVTVDCGAIARVANQGETFDCKLTDANGKARTARITVRDEVGNVYVTVL